MSRLTDEHRKFRQEVIDFFMEARRPEWYTLDRESEEFLAIGREMDRRLIERGWYTMHWPEEFGGQGDMIRNTILRELEGYFRVPTYGGHGRFIVGPALLAFGTEEQKQKYLPGIADGSLVICEGLTEPDAGSDLGSMRTSAVPRGDEYMINGTKLYVTFGHYANAMLLAARTDPEAPNRDAVSLFLIDMNLPGMEVSPLYCLTDHRVNEIVFKDVAIPSGTLLGEKNKGFYHMALALNFERSGVERPGRFMAELEGLVEHARETGRWSDPGVRAKCGELAALIAAWRQMAWRVAWLQAGGAMPTWEASAAELYRKLINPLMGDVVLEVMGHEALLNGRDEAAPHSGHYEYLMRESFNNHGQGGRLVTRNVIARRGLKLPKS